MPAPYSTYQVTTPTVGCLLTRVQGTWYQVQEPGTNKYDVFCSAFLLPDQVPGTMVPGIQDPLIVGIVRQV